MGVRNAQCSGTGSIPTISVVISLPYQDCPVFGISGEPTESIRKKFMKNSYSLCSIRLMKSGTCASPMLVGSVTLLLRRASLHSSNRGCSSSTILRCLSSNCMIITPYVLCIQADLRLDQPVDPLRTPLLPGLVHVVPDPC